MKHCRLLFALPVLFLFCLTGCRVLAPPDEAEARQLAKNELRAFCQANGFDRASFVLREFTKNEVGTAENRGSSWTARYRATHPDGKPRYEIVLNIFDNQRMELSFLDYDE